MDQKVTKFRKPLKLFIFKTKAANIAGAVNMCTYFEPRLQKRFK